MPEAARTLPRQRGSGRGCWRWGCGLGGVVLLGLACGIHLVFNPQDRVHGPLPDIPPVGVFLCVVSDQGDERVAMPWAPAKLLAGSMHPDRCVWSDSGEWKRTGECLRPVRWVPGERAGVLWKS